MPIKTLRWFSWPMALVVVAVFASACAPQSSAAGTVVRDMEPRDAWALLQAGPAFLVDVRTPEEVAQGTVAGVDATADWNAGSASLLAAVAAQPKDAPIVLYCRSGRRSRAAAELLAERGYSNVVNVAGGIAAWSAAGLPLSRP